MLAQFARQTVPATQMTLSYVPQDRVWADWIEALLLRAGISVERSPLNVLGPSDLASLPPDAPQRTVAIVSHEYVRALDQIGQAEFHFTERSLLAVRVRDLVDVPRWWPRNVVSLVGLERDAAAAALMEALGLRVGHRVISPELEVRFPGSTPSISNLPLEMRVSSAATNY